MFSQGGIRLSMVLEVRWSMVQGWASGQVVRWSTVQERQEGQVIHGTEGGVGSGGQVGQGKDMFSVVFVLLITGGSCGLLSMEKGRLGRGVR